MRSFLSYQLILISVFLFLEVKGFFDDDLFNTEDLGDFHDPTPFYSDSSSDLSPDLSPDLFSFDDSTGDFYQDDWDTLPSLPGVDETQPEVLLSDCSAANGLRARDDSSFCPTNTNEFKLPELPSLDRVTGKFMPPDERDNPLREMSPMTFPGLTGHDDSCPPDRPYGLCCICDGKFDFQYCHDCLQSKSSIYFREQSNHKRFPNWG